MNGQNRGEHANSEAKFSYFKVNLAVRYREPQTFKDPTGKPLVAAGYFRKFVVVARSEDEARSILSREAEDGQVDWQESEFERANLDDLAEFSIKQNDLPSESSVVFRSSHFLYP
jgi:hypothetical protein